MISKLWLKRTIGRVAEIVRPSLSREVAAANPEAISSRLGKCILAAQTHRAAAKGAWDDLRARLAGYWQGAEGDQFYDAYPERFEAWFLKAHYPMVEAMVAAAGTGEFHQLVEIGCGDGRVLEHVAGRLPQLEKLTGLDINPGIIARNRTTYAAQTRLTFESGDALAWLQQHAQPGSILMTYGGVFEYFTQAELAKLFGHFANQLRPALVALVEPLGDDFNVEETTSRPYGTECSFSHPHRRLLEAAGFDVVFEQEVRLDHRWIMMVARTAGQS